LIYADLFFSAFYDGVTADVPVMYVERDHLAAQLLDAYRIEAAGDRLAERAFPCEKAFLYGAQAVAVRVEMRERALLRPRHQRRDDVPFQVDLEEAFLRHGGFARFAHLRGIRIVAALQLLQFAFVHRRSAFADDAAFTLAFLIVAAKEIQKDILGDQHVPYLHYGSKSVYSHGQKITYSTLPAMEIADNKPSTYAGSSFLTLSL